MCEKPFKQFKYLRQKQKSKKPPSLEKIIPASNLRALTRQVDIRKIATLVAGGQRPPRVGEWFFWPMMAIDKFFFEGCWNLS